MSTAVIGTVLEAFFFNSKVDKTSDAVQKVLKQVDMLGQSLMATGFSGMSTQRIELFNSLNLQLQNFKVVYADLLDQTVDKIGKEASAKLYQIDTIVHDWTQGVTDPKIEKHIAQIEGIALSMPFVKDIPRVTAFFPTFVAPSIENYNVLIECLGNFPSVNGAHLKPTLVLGQKKFGCVQQLSLKVHFSVPFSEIFPEVKKMQVRSFTVQIPYVQKGTFMNSVSQYEFQGSLTLLPESPGKVMLQFSKFKSDVETKQIRSHTFIQNSRKDALNKTLLNHPYTLSTEHGWQVVAGSTKFQVEENKGDRKMASWNLAVDLPSHVTWNVSTHHYDPPYKHCDKITFHITALLSRTMQTPVISSEEFALKWGDSIEIDTSKGDYTATFQSFDGTTEALQPNVFGKYVMLAIRNGRPILSAKSPEYLSSINFHHLVSHQSKL